MKSTSKIHEIHDEGLFSKNSIPSTIDEYLHLLKNRMYQWFNTEIRTSVDNDQIFIETDNGNYMISNPLSTETLCIKVALLRRELISFAEKMPFFFSARFSYTMVKNSERHLTVVEARPVLYKNEIRSYQHIDGSERESLTDEVVRFIYNMERFKKECFDIP